MNWKEFLKLNLWKIIIFIVLIALVSFLPHYSKICVPSPVQQGEFDCGYQKTSFGVGYPHFFGEFYSGDVVEFGFNFVNLIINIVVYYILGCFIFLLIQNLKRPK